jgi:hypothetical protein
LASGYSTICAKLSSPSSLGGQSAAHRQGKAKGKHRRGEVHSENRSQGDPVRLDRERLFGVRERLDRRGRVPDPFDQLRTIRLLEQERWRLGAHLGRVRAGEALG